jgi:hypothetical protein
MIRVDVAIDSSAGKVLVSEIEGGLDYSIFPYQVKSHGITEEVTSIVSQEAIRMWMANRPVWPSQAPATGSAR